MRTATFAMLKPDVTQSGAFLEILDLIRAAGFRVALMKLHRLTMDQAAAFYREHADKPFFPGLVTQMLSAPVVAMVLTRDEDTPGAFEIRWREQEIRGDTGRVACTLPADGIAAWRQLLGATDPAKAAPGTIRARYGTGGPKNAAHGSDSLESAIREACFFFGDEAAALFPVPAARDAHQG